MADAWAEDYFLIKRCLTPRYICRPAVQVEHTFIPQDTRCGMERKIGERSGVAFVGFLFLGIAIGFLYHQTVVGFIGGLGLGFISMALLADSK